MVRLTASELLATRYRQAQENRPFASVCLGHEFLVTTRSMIAQQGLPRGIPGIRVLRSPKESLRTPVVGAKLPGASEKPES
jgi:hypothetical protein